MLGDPDTILEWLRIQDETRECQLLALDQLCQDILFSDNIDSFFSSYSPNAFLPALCQVLMDETAPDNVLETAARALTYFLDVSSNILHIIFKVECFIPAICRRLDFVDMSSEKSNELSQQILKLLSLLICDDPASLYAGGSLLSVLTYVKNYSHLIHSDVLKSGMEIIQRLCSSAEPTDTSLSDILEYLTELIGYSEPNVSDNALKALGNLVERFGKKAVDTCNFVTPQVVDKLLKRLRVAGGVESITNQSESSKSIVNLNLSNLDTFDDFENYFVSHDQNIVKNSTLGSTTNPAVVNSITNILLTICCNSPALTRQLLASDGCLATTLALIMLKGEESIVLSIMKLAEVLLILLYEVKPENESRTVSRNDVISRKVTTNECHIVNIANDSNNSISKNGLVLWETDQLYLKFVESLKDSDLELARTHLQDIIKKSTSGEMGSTILVDNIGQHIFHWLVAYGPISLFNFALAEGLALPDEHQTPCAIMSALDYAIEMGRVDFCKHLLQLKPLDFWFSLPKKSFFNPLERARYASSLTDEVRLEIVELLTPHLEDTSQLPSMPQTQQVDPLKQISRSTSPGSDTPVTFVGAKDQETVRIQKVFVRQLITVVVNVFRSSTHSILKFHAVSLVKRMIGYITVDHLKELSNVLVRGLPFSYHIAELIFTVLVEEAEELVLHALELSHYLLIKQSAIYVVIFHRIGMVSLIKTLNNIVATNVSPIAAHKYYSHVKSKVIQSLSEAAEVQAKREKGEKKREERKLKAQRKDDDEDSIGFGLIFGEINETSNAHLKINTGAEMDISSSQTSPAVVSAQDSTVTGPQEALSILENFIPTLRPNFVYIWRDWNICILEDMLHIFSSYAHVSCPIEFCDENTSECSTETNKLPPLIFHCLFSTKSDGPFALEVNRNGKNLDKNSSRNLWYGRYEHVKKTIQDEKLPIIRLFETKNSDDFKEVKPPRIPLLRFSRLHSSPASICDEFLSNQRQVRIGMIKFRTGFITPLTHKNLFLEVHQTESTPASNSSPKFVLAFSSCVTDGFYRIEYLSDSVFSENPSIKIFTSKRYDRLESLQSSQSYLNFNVSTDDIKRNYNRPNNSEIVIDLSRKTKNLPANPQSELPEIAPAELSTSPCSSHSKSTEDKTQLPSTQETAQKSKEPLARITCSTGDLTKTLDESSKSHTDTSKKKDVMKRLLLQKLEAVRLRIYQLSQYLLDMELKLPLVESVNSSPLPTESPNLSVHNSRQLIRINSAIQIRSFLDVLKQIKATIDEASIRRLVFQSAYGSNSALDFLDNAFCQLADILKQGEHTVTSYELAISGLITSLWFCLSATHASQWHIESCDRFHTHYDLCLWYLRERRRLFCRRFDPSHGGVGLVSLTRKLVHHIEQIERLPLHLYESAQEHHGKLIFASVYCAKLLHRWYKSKQMDTKEFESLTLPMGIISSFSIPHSEALNLITKHGLDMPPMCIQRSCTMLALYCPYLLNSTNNRLSQLISHFRIMVAKDHFNTTPHNISRCLSTASQPKEEQTSYLPITLDGLYDWTGKELILTPLVTVGQVEQSLSKLSTLQWYDYERSNLKYYHTIIESPEGLFFPPPSESVFSYSSGNLKIVRPLKGSTDQLGLFDWMATNAGTLFFDEWVNPAQHGMITVLSSCSCCTTNQPEYIFAPQGGNLKGNAEIPGPGCLLEASPVSNKPETPTTMPQYEYSNVSLVIDLGMQFTPCAYTLSFLRDSSLTGERMQLKNWNLEASNNARKWIRLCVHMESSEILPNPGSTFTWPVPYQSLMPLARNTDQRSPSHTEKKSVPVEPGQLPKDLYVQFDEIAANSCESTVQGWRFFRLVRNSWNCEESWQLPIGGIEFYGAVHIVHDQLINKSSLESLVKSRHLISKTTATVSNTSEVSSTIQPLNLPVPSWAKSKRSIGSSSKTIDISRSISHPAENITTNPKRRATSATLNSSTKSEADLSTEKNNLFKHSPKMVSMRSSNGDREAASAISGTGPDSSLFQFIDADTSSTKTLDNKSSSRGVSPEDYPGIELLSTFFAELDTTQPQSCLSNQEEVSNATSETTEEPLVPTFKPSLLSSVPFTSSSEPTSEQKHDEKINTSEAMEDVYAEDDNDEQATDYDDSVDLFGEAVDAIVSLNRRFQDNVSFRDLFRGSISGSNLNSETSTNREHIVETPDIKSRELKSSDSNQDEFQQPPSIKTRMKLIRGLIESYDERKPPEKDANNIAKDSSKTSRTLSVNSTEFSKADRKPSRSIFRESQSSSTGGSRNESPNKTHSDSQNNIQDKTKPQVEISVNQQPKLAIGKKLVWHQDSKTKIKHPSELIPAFDPTQGKGNIPASSAYILRQERMWCESIETILAQANQISGYNGQPEGHLKRLSLALTKTVYVVGYPELKKTFHIEMYDKSMPIFKYIYDLIDQIHSYVESLEAYVDENRTGSRNSRHHLNTNREKDRALFTNNKPLILLKMSQPVSEGSCTDSQASRVDDSQSDDICFEEYCEDFDDEDVDNDEIEPESDALQEFTIEHNHLGGIGGKDVKISEMRILYRIYDPEDDQLLGRAHQNLTDVEPLSKAPIWWADQITHLDPSKTSADQFFSPQDLRLNSFTKGSVAEASRKTKNLDEIEVTMHLLRMIHQLSSSDKDDRVIQRPQRQIIRRHLTSINGGEELFSSQFSQITSQDSTLDLLQPDDFISRKLTRKMITQMEDPLAMATGALPEWTLKSCQRLSSLYPLSIRVQLFRALASGTARSVIWLQSHPPSASTIPTFNLPAANLSGLPESILTVLSPSLGGSSAQHIFAQIDPPSNPQTPSKSTLANKSGSVDLDLSNMMHILQKNTSNDGGATTKQESWSSGVGSSALTIVLNSLNSALKSVNSSSLKSESSNNSGQPSQALLQALKSFADVNKLLENPVALSRLISTDSTQKDGFTGHRERRKTIEIVRLHKEFVRIPRYCSSESNPNDVLINFWDFAAQTMHEHADRKAELEIQFVDEVGTGLGPTMEFFSLISKELCRKSNLMWVCTDDSKLTNEDEPTADQSSFKQRKMSTNHEDPSLFVHTASGLFPAAVPQDQLSAVVIQKFYVLGITVAKALQDNRRIDLTFSTPFIKLLLFYACMKISQSLPKESKKFSEASINRRISVESSSSARESRKPVAGQKRKCSTSTGESLDPSLVSTSKMVPIEQLEIITDEFNRLAERESVVSRIKVFKSNEHNSMLHRIQSTPNTASWESKRSAKPLEDPLDSDLWSMQGILTEPTHQIQRRKISHCADILNAESMDCEDSSQKMSIDEHPYSCKSEKHWLTGVLDMDDFTKIYPERGRFMQSIWQFVIERRAIERRIQSGHNIQDRISQLAHQTLGVEDIADLFIEMEFKPTSVIFGAKGYPLFDTYTWEGNQDPKLNEEKTVTLDNLSTYLRRTLEFALDKGIRTQMDAFIVGFERVFPCTWLALFDLTELSHLISGDSSVKWTRDELLMYTLPGRGYSSLSPTYCMLIEVLDEMSVADRRAFLQFTTGCSTLPLGGLKNLQPHIQVVRKELKDSGPYPSVNTCRHYLKLPPYDSKEELKTRLMAATREIGFYLN